MEIFVADFPCSWEFLSVGNFVAGKTVQLWSKAGGILGSWAAGQLFKWVIGALGSWESYVGNGVAETV